MATKQVATLIADPSYQPLTDAELNMARAVLAEAGAKPAETRWLSDARAADVCYIGLTSEVVQKVLREALPHVDVIAQEAGTRRKRLLICDMDSTIIQQECIDEIADFAGFRAQVEDITERAMNGELDFADSLRARVGLLKGLESEVLERAFRERIELTPGAKELVQTMRSDGAYCMLVSGGFTFFTSRVSDAVGFDENRANMLIIGDDNRLTGMVQEPILDKNAKLTALMERCADRQIPVRESLAVGDGANDLPMLMAAGLGVAYHAKPVVREAARAFIDRTDLKALLYAQGYPEEEIFA